MTERKPPGMTWETWIDRQIRTAQDQGAFENLSLRGKPLPDLDRPRDGDWWTKKLVQREGIDALPKTLRVRKQLDQALVEIAAATDEAEVRTIVATINEAILDVNRKAASGPPSNMMPLDIDRVLATWAEGREEQAG